MTAVYSSAVLRDPQGLLRLQKSHKLLDGFDPRLFADHIFFHVSRFLSGRDLTNKNPRYLSAIGLYTECQGFLPYRSSYHIQLAFVKAIKLLQREGKIEIVSLAKTRLRRGIVVCDSCAMFRFDLSPKVEARVCSLLHPSRWIQRGCSAM